jgi:hypothetical protein
MDKYTELKSHLYTDVSGRWVHASDVDRLIEYMVVDIVQSLSLNATCFDGDVQRGIKVAARLVKERYE